MADQGMSEAAMLAGLHDIRLPADAVGGFGAEMAVMVGLGLFCAWGLALLLPIFARPPALARPAPAMAERVAALRHRPDPARAVALLHLMRTQAPDAAPARDTLYTRGSFPSIEKLEAALLCQGTEDG